MYIYESHMDGLFISDDEIDFDQLYCETCGDCDSLIGYVETMDEAFELLKDWDHDYVEEILKDWMEDKT